MGPLLRRLERRLIDDPVLIDTHEVMGDTACWVAGGWIRDRAIGRQPPDLDLVVAGDAAAAETPARRLGRAHGVHAHLLGRPPRAVWRVQADSLHAEIWPLGDLTPEDDAARRDFTCNALLWRLPKGPLIDPCGGLGDIHQQILRAVGRGNLVADPVRLLRAPRLTTSLNGFSIEQQTASWIAELASHLARSPRERIGAEFQTMAAGTGAGHGFELAHELGLLGPAGPQGHYDPDVTALKRLTGALPHPVPAAARAAGGAAILAWLVNAWGVATAHELAPYAWGRKTVQVLLRTVNSLDATWAMPLSSAADRRQSIAHAAGAFPALLALAGASDPMADIHAPFWRRFWRQWRRSGAAILGARSPLDAEEVATISGLEPGPALGRSMQALHTAVVRSEVRSRSGARKWLRAYSVGSSV